MAKLTSTKNGGQRYRIVEHFSDGKMDLGRSEGVDGIHLSLNFNDGERNYRLKFTAEETQELKAFLNFKT